MNIKIAGRYFEIIEEAGIHNEEGTALLGQITIDKALIKIAPNQAEQVKYSTFVHEVVHGISDMYGLNLLEDQVSILAHGLVQVEEDNHETLAAIRRGEYK